MNRFVIVLQLLLLWRGMSSEEFPSPEVTRDYQSSTDPKQCVILCLVPVVTQANLLWINGSVLYSSLMITDLNTKLYLVVDYQDKNNYSCVVSSSGVNQTAHLNIYRICQPCRDETLTVSTSEGDSVTLPTSLTQVLFYDDIRWIHKNACIAELFKNSSTYHDCDNCGLNNRLQLDSKTGSLTITNISKIHSALYKLQITNTPLEECLTKSYYLNVYDPLPKPDINKNSTRCSSSSKCVVMCSVNVTGVTLSWYNGSRLNSSISVSDLKRSNFLCLEVEYQDTNTYKCVVNNSFTNRTKQLHINDLCKDQQNNLHYLAFLVLVPAVILCLIYCYRRKNRQRGASRGQNAFSFTAAQGNAVTAEDREETSGTSAQDNVGASGQGTSGNNATEETSLIVHQSSSQESLPSNILCCPK